MLRILANVGAHITLVAVGGPQQLGPVKSKDPLLCQLFFRADHRRTSTQVLPLAQRKLRLLSLTGENHRFRGGDPEHTAMLSQAERQIRAGTVEAAARTLNMISLSVRTAPDPGTKNCTWITATRKQRRALALRALETFDKQGIATFHYRHPKDELKDTVLIEGQRHRMNRAVFQAVPDDGIGEARRINNGALGIVKGWCFAEESQAEPYAVFRPDNQRKAFRVPLSAVTTAAVMTIAASQGDTFEGMAVLDCTDLRVVYRTRSTLLQALCVATTRSKHLRIMNYTPEILLAEDTAAPPTGDAAVVVGLQGTMRRLIKGQTIRMIPRLVKVPTVSQACLQNVLLRKFADNPAAVTIVEWYAHDAKAVLANGVEVRAVAH